MSTTEPQTRTVSDNEFRVSDVPPGSARLVGEAAVFNVCTGAVLRGPAQQSLTTYRVVIDRELGRAEATAPQAVDTHS